jgi:pimeloyl-ACP methyl ester carboxylesterase
MSRHYTPLLPVWVLSVAAILLATFLAPGCASSPELREEGAASARVITGAADEAAGFHWPYFLYLPEHPAEGTLPLILISNNTPGPADEYRVHRRQAEGKIEQYRHLSDATGLPLLIPAIPRFYHRFPDPEIEQDDAWLVNPQALTRNALLTPDETLARMDLQVCRILDDAVRSLQEEGIQAAKEAVVFGFSASGSFAHRFSLLHPERVSLEIAGAPGGWYTLPLAEYRGRRLRYPVGIADLKELTGEAFRRERYRQIPKFFFVGSEDGDDAVPYLDSYSYEDRVTIMELFGREHMERYRRAAQLFAEEGMRARLRIYEGVGHAIPPEAWSEIYTFIRGHLELPAPRAVR